MLFVFVIFCVGAAHVRGLEQTSHLGRVTKTVPVTFCHCPSSAPFTPIHGTNSHPPASVCSAHPAPTTTTTCPASAPTHHPTDCETLSINLKNTPNPSDLFRYIHVVCLMYLIFFSSSLSFFFFFNYVVISLYGKLCCPSS